MKKFVLIVGGIAAALVAAITVLTWFALGKAERDANRKRTEPARAARHAKVEPESEQENIVETN